MTQGSWIEQGAGGVVSTAVKRPSRFLFYLVGFYQKGISAKKCFVQNRKLALSKTVFEL